MRSWTATVAGTMPWLRRTRLPEAARRVAEKHAARTVMIRPLSEERTTRSPADMRLGRFSRRPPARVLGRGPGAQR